VLATTGDDGDARSPDQVLRTSSRIAAVVSLYPPTDIRTWVTDPPEAIKKIPALKPPLSFDAAKAGDYSPALHVTARTPPTLLIHGDKDELVPIEHSRKMIAALEREKVASRLLVIEGAAHGFNAEQNRIVVPAMVDWFVKNLVDKKDLGAAGAKP
jgi:dipeptidyl aminopeptidase/acylaminoacyl peptidase